MGSRLAQIALLTMALGAGILLRFYGGGSDHVGEPTPGDGAQRSQAIERVAEAVDAVGAVNADEDAGGNAFQSPDDVPPTTASGLQVFLEVRGIPLAGHVAQDLHDFVAQPRDPWSAGGVSLLRAQSGVLVEWHRFHRRCGPDWHCLE